MDIVLKDECYRVMGACFEVYKEMGQGLLVSVYRECLALEFRARDIPAEGQTRLPLRYKGDELEQGYIVDFVCFEDIIVEIKAVDKLSPADDVILLNYLHATGKPLGLLVNFGATGNVEWRRLVV